MAEDLLDDGQLVPHGTFSSPHVRDNSVRRRQLKNMSAIYLVALGIELVMTILSFFEQAKMIRSRNIDTSNFDYFGTSNS